MLVGQPARLDDSTSTPIALNTTDVTYLNVSLDCAASASGAPGGVAGGASSKHSRSHASSLQSLGTSSHDQLSQSSGGGGGGRSLGDDNDTGICNIEHPLADRWPTTDDDDDADADADAADVTPATPLVDAGQSVGRNAAPQLAVSFTGNLVPAAAAARESDELVM